LKNEFSNLIKNFTLTESEVASLPKSESQNHWTFVRLMKKPKFFSAFSTRDVMMKMMMKK